MTTQRPILEIARSALERRQAEGLLRDRRAHTISGPPGPRVCVRGRTLSNFASNGYLGLSTHPRVVSAFVEETERSGTSATASRLLSGSHEAVEDLEQTLAAFKGTEDALVFSSGYLANLGVLYGLGSALEEGTKGPPGAWGGQREPVFLSDESNHASIIDGCRLARVEVLVYRHRDAEDVERQLKSLGGRRAVIVTEGRFSMDGDIAPLPELADLAERYGATFVVDEAHSTGIDGGGRGLVHAFGLTSRTDLVVGTLGKALGAHGAFVAGSRTLLRWLENCARSFVFTTALPAPFAAAARRAIEVVLEERPDLQLARNIASLRDGLASRGLLGRVLASSSGPILPIVVGDPERASLLGRALDEFGILSAAIRPPTVPPGTSRIRISVRADHERSDLDRLLDALDRARATYDER